MVIFHPNISQPVSDFTASFIHHLFYEISSVPQVTSIKRINPKAKDVQLAAMETYFDVFAQYVSWT